MARSRRRSPMRSTRPRVRKDWVYTIQGYLSGVFSQTSGVAFGLAQPLTVPQGSQRIITQGTDSAVPAVNDYQRSAALPAVKPHSVFAVEADLYMFPSSWAIGNSFLWGWRLLIFDCDPTTMSIEVDGDYSMWQNGAAPFSHFSVYRNASNVLAEGRIIRDFNSSFNGPWHERIRWSSSRGRRIGEQQAVFLYLEGSSSSVNSARNRLYSRALISAPSA